MAYQGTNWELKKFVNRLAIASASKMLGITILLCDRDDTPEKTKYTMAESRIASAAHHRNASADRAKLDNNGDG